MIDDLDVYRYIVDLSRMEADAPVEYYRLGLVHRSCVARHLNIGALDSLKRLGEETLKQRQKCPSFITKNQKNKDSYQDISGADGKYYSLPEGASELADLINYRNMNFNIGNIFKACYRLGQKEGVSVKYDLEKIRCYIDLELRRLGIKYNDRTYN